jgi:adenylate kinase
MKVYLFMGMQGSGKGTQAKIISKELNLCHISTGDLLRETKGKLGEKIHNLINSGNMVSDELILEMIEQRIKQYDCKYGIILDGYPRNVKQAKTLDAKFKVEEVIEIQISDEEAYKRLSGRYNCKECNAGYNIYAQPKPKQKGICDLCKGELYQRKDDNPEAIKKRIKEYHIKTEPVLDYYKNKLITINGEQPIEKITKEILKKLV